MKIFIKRLAIVMIFIFGLFQTAHAAIIGFNINGNIEKNYFKRLLQYPLMAINSESIAYVESYYNDEFKSSGCGIIISKDGQVLLPYQIIDRANRVIITLRDGKTYETKEVKNYDKDVGIAILKINSDRSFYPAILGNSESLKKGDEVVNIASPYKNKYIFSQGELSELNNEAIKIKFKNENNGGWGGVFDRSFKLVAITYVVMDEMGTVYGAIPVNEVKEMSMIDRTITLSDVQKEVYQNLTLSQFTKQLNNKFSVLRINNYIIKTDTISIIDGNGENVYLLISLNTSYYNNYVKAMNDKTLGFDYNEGLVESWLGTISDEVSKYYPDKNIEGGLFYLTHSKEKPTGFAESELSYDTEFDYWAVVKSLKLFSNKGGNFEFEHI